MPEFHGKSIWLMLTLMACINNLQAQKESYNWYFGNKAGISFHTDPPTTLLNGELSTVEGCAAISDIKGQLLFYTDGIKVYNRNHQVMPNGTGLKGHQSSSQAAIIVPKPGDNDIFYLITADAIGGKNGICYSLVDIRLDDGQGDIVKDKKNITLTTKATEKLIAVKHRNNIDIWVIAYSAYDDFYYIFLLTDKGINLQKITSSGLEPRKGLNIGYLKISPDGVKLANAFDGAGAIDFFIFKNDSGSLIYHHTFDHPGVYGIEFSPDGNYIYSAGMAVLYQHSALTLKSQKVGGTVEGAALQLGPDGKIYIAQTNTKFLGVIENPNVKQPGCNHKADAIDLKGRDCRFGLPNFLAFSFEPTFNFENLCFGEATFFIAGNIAPGATISWKFNDVKAFSDTSAGKNPTHKFSAPGEYEVIMTVNNNGVISTVKRKINIKLSPWPVPEKLIRICPGNFAELDAGNAGAVFLWNTGMKSQKIKVNEAGFYSVKISKDGCSRTDTIEVQIKDTVKVDLGDDKYFCSGEKTILDAGNNGDAFYWSTSETTQKITVAKPGNYWVTKIKEGCMASDTILLFLNDTVLANLGKDSAYCYGETIELDAGSGADAYLWSTKDITQRITVNKPGIYSVLKTKKSCTAPDTVKISFYPKTGQQLIDTALCENEEESILLFAGDGKDYSWFPGDAITQKLAVTKAGTYSVNYTNINGCTQKKQFNVKNRCDFSLYLPNSFKPTSPVTSNNQFRATGHNIISFRMQVYNRWGELIFAANRLEDGWDGCFKGSVCPEGVYLYVIEYTASTGNLIVNKFLNGTFTLLR